MKFKIVDLITLIPLFGHINEPDLIKSRKYKYTYVCV